MRRLSVFCILLLICVSAFCSSYGFSLENIAMGRTAIAPAGYSVDCFCNPSSLYFHNGDNYFVSSLRTGLSHEDGIFKSEFRPEVSFIGRNISLDLAGGFDFSSDGSPSYPFRQLSDLDFVMSFGRGNFSFGLGAAVSSGRSSSESFPDGLSPWEVFSKGFFSMMPRDDSLTGLTIRSGLAFSSTYFAAGILFDDEIRLTEDEIKISWRNLFDAGSFGLRVSNDRFSSRGRLNLFHVSASFDWWNVFSKRSEMRFGLKSVLQFSKAMDLGLLAGYRLHIADRSLDEVSMGLQLRFDDISLNAAAVSELEHPTDMSILVALTYLI